MADRRRRAPLPRPRLGHRGHQHRPLPPARRRGHPTRRCDALHAHVGRDPAPAATIELAERLARPRARSSTDPQVFFCNTGAEAVDGAIKLARRITGRPGIVAFRRGFHGRTLRRHVAHHRQGASTSEGYEPLLPRRARIAPLLRDGATPAELDALDELLATCRRRAEHRRGDDRRAGARRGRLRRAAGRVAARACASAATRHGILLVFDEVQSRHRAHRSAVRGRDLRRHPRRRALRQGRRLGPAARRDHRAAPR